MVKLRQAYPSHRPCKYCSEEVAYNNEIKSWVNWGGENDGLVHRDKRQGNTIDATSKDTKMILEQVALLHSKIDRLRSAVWENGQKQDMLWSKLVPK